jgi:hypothetical protein
VIAVLALCALAAMGIVRRQRVAEPAPANPGGLGRP